MILQYFLSDIQKEQRLFMYFVLLHRLIVFSVRCKNKYITYTFTDQQSNFYYLYGYSLTNMFLVLPQPVSFLMIEHIVLSRNDKSITHRLIRIIVPLFFAIVLKLLCLRIFTEIAKYLWPFIKPKLLKCCVQAAANCRETNMNLFA